MKDVGCVMWEWKEMMEHVEFISTKSHNFVYFSHDWYKGDLVGIFLKYIVKNVPMSDYFVWFIVSSGIIQI